MYPLLMICLIFMFRYILYSWSYWSLCSYESSIYDMFDLYVQMYHLLMICLNFMFICILSWWSVRYVQIYPPQMICLICIIWETSLSCVEPGTWSRKLSPASRSTRRTGLMYSRGLRNTRILTCSKISVTYFRIKFKVLGFIQLIKFDFTISLGGIKKTLLSFKKIHLIKKYSISNVIFLQGYIFLRHIIPPPSFFGFNASSKTQLK